ncbi:MAG: nickel pincer cofactor biosynthesis protein LarB, partial [Oscillospiraceae bacterium]|nr:nickel pincer cofactor biosynthesis protein LarB [Oscillospiraceae bacterium]
MDERAILDLLSKVKAGTLFPSEAAKLIQQESFVSLGYATVDTQRKARQGVAEVIYGASKTPEQIRGICQTMTERGEHNILVTRMSAQAAALVSESLPLSYHELPKLGVVAPEPTEQLGEIAVVSAGTSDLPVAEEAAITAETLGNRVSRIYDVGVAGLHRLLARLDELNRARVIVAVAGMEGALASVVGGLVSCPVIAVPTSVGYGANFGGLSALLAMLNSCAAGVSVVNIDNGFGAAVQAS